MPCVYNTLSHIDLVYLQGAYHIFAADEKPGIHGSKEIFLRSNISSRILESNPGVPDATPPRLFPVALRKVDL